MMTRFLVHRSSGWRCRENPSGCASLLHAKSSLRTPLVRHQCEIRLIVGARSVFVSFSFFTSRPNRHALVRFAFNSPVIRKCDRVRCLTCGLSTASGCAANMGVCVGFCTRNAVGMESSMSSISSSFVCLCWMYFSSIFIDEPFGTTNLFIFRYKTTHIEIQ